jgi:hypothetical protein
VRGRHVAKDIEEGPRVAYIRHSVEEEKEAGARLLIGV